MARMYTPAWQALKLKGVLVIAAHPKQHARIYKAIQKEKWMDTVFHLEQLDKEIKTVMARSSKGSALTITLSYRPSIYGCVL